MSSPNIRVAIAYHSGFGHTAKQAEAVARGAASVEGTQVELFNLAELTDELWDGLDKADAIIFGSPTYMGSPSAVFKTFAEATSKVFADNMRWRDKIAAGFTHSQTINGDKLNTLIYFVILAMQQGMHWVGLDIYAGWDSSKGSIEDLNRLGSWVGAMAQSNVDASLDIVPIKSDLETAAVLGRRVALVTQRWVRGHQKSAQELLDEEQAAYVTPHRAN